MGAASQILLVIALLLCSPAQAAVNAAEHRAFWLWSGVKPTSEMARAEVVYLHQGEILRRGNGVVFERLGLPVSRLTFPQIWITVRITTLDVPERFWQRVFSLMQRWQRAGNRVIGLQIDFDAATQRLADYADFLTRLRAVLPEEYALGVTGLLDWAKTGSITTINQLPIDELVVQTYQGRKTVENYAAYLPALRSLAIPWKVGLVQGGEWDSGQRAELQRSPWFRGTVVFMLNSR